MSYAVKEVFHTLQGEARRAGRAAAFCRFAGCNPWREGGRASAACTVCDTETVGTLVLPQAAARPERFEPFGFGQFVPQPMDGPEGSANTAAAVRNCMAHPHWRLGVRTHTVPGIA